MRPLLMIATATAALSAWPVLAMDGPAPNSFVLARGDVGLSTDSSASYDWDAQGWIGGDENRLWLKTAGDMTAGPTDRADFQVLYSRAFGDFWDVQAGLRQTVEPTGRTAAVVGVQGLAPYWFEVDAAAFLDDRGRVSARLEVSYELTLTQKLFAEPYGVVRAAGEADQQLLEGSGVTDVEAGLRLRYEFSRKVAPYVGIGWSSQRGETARIWEAAGEDSEETTIRLGLRLLL